MVDDLHWFVETIKPWVIIFIIYKLIEINHELSIS